MVGRQAADAEHQQALGQIGDRRLVIQTAQQVVEQAGAVRVTVAGQFAPQQRLPGFVRAQVEQLVALPGGEPVVALQQVLVENVGDLAGQR